MAAGDWPTHDNKAWRAVLDRARALGWPTPAWTSSHPKLVMNCPAGNPACTITAFSTGNNTERVAIQSLARLDRCPHRAVKDDLAKVDIALDMAERFLGAAETLRQRGVAGARLSELLELASTEVDAAAKVLEREFDHVSETYEELSALAGTLLESDPDTVDFSQVTAEADSNLRTARKVLSELPKRSDAVATRRERLDVLVGRRDALQT